LNEAIPIANDFAYIYAVNETAHEGWLFAYYFGGSWQTFPGYELTQFEYGKSYYFNDFTENRTLISYGKVPRGNITRTIYSEESNDTGQTLLAGESLTSSPSLNEAIPIANDFAYIYAVNETAHEGWLFAYYLGGSWQTFLGYELTNLIGSKGHYFNDFATRTSCSYERNPA
jgi:hypothetical protein